MKVAVDTLHHQSYRLRSDSDEPSSGSRIEFSQIQPKKHQVLTVVDVIGLFVDPTVDRRLFVKAGV